MCTTQPVAQTWNQGLFFNSSSHSLPHSISYSSASLADFSSRTDCECLPPHCYCGHAGPAPAMMAPPHASPAPCQPRPLPHVISPSTLASSDGFSFLRAYNCHVVTIIVLTILHDNYKLDGKLVLGAQHTDVINAYIVKYLVKYLAKYVNTHHLAWCK